MHKLECGECEGTGRYWGSPCEYCKGVGTFIACERCRDPNDEPISELCFLCLEQDAIDDIADEQQRIAAGLASDARARA